MPFIFFKLFNILIKLFKLDLLLVERLYTPEEILLSAALNNASVKSDT